MWGRSLVLSLQGMPELARKLYLLLKQHVFSFQFFLIKDKADKGTAPVGLGPFRKLRGIQI